MQLELDDSQAELLRELLDSAFRDLSYEIADTDNRTYKDNLKARRVTLAALLEQVGGPLPDQD
jgi:hypothetical protein